MSFWVIYLGFLGYDFMRFWDSGKANGFRVWGVVFRFGGLRVWGFGFWGLGFRAYGCRGLWIRGLGILV